MHLIGLSLPAAPVGSPFASSAGASPVALPEPLDGMGAPRGPRDLSSATRLLSRDASVRLTPVWSVPLDMTRGSFFHPPPPVFSKDSVFAGDNQSYLRLDAASGQVAWRARLGAGEEFLQHEPMLLGQGIGLHYQYDRGKDQLKGVGLLILDAESGEVKSRIAGDFISKFRADPAGNIYHTADHGALLRVSPQGLRSTLRPPEREMVCLPDLEVTATGLPIFQRVDQSAASSQLCAFDGLAERVITNRYVAGLTVSPDGGAYASLDYSRLARLDSSGRIRWERHEEFGTTTLAALPDNSLVAFNDSSGHRGLVCYDTDGRERWRKALPDSQLGPLDGIQRWALVPRPNGDVLLTEQFCGVVLAFGPDGQDRWRHVSGQPRDMSISPDERLYLSNPEGFQRLDLATGQLEVEYSSQEKRLTRYADGAEQFSFQVIDPPEICGPIVQTAPETIAMADRSGRMAGYRLPAHWSESAVDLEPCQAAPVQLLGGYVRVGGVLVPMRRGAPVAEETDTGRRSADKTFTLLC